MLRDYVDWWVGQLTGLIPERLRLSVFDEANILVIEPDGDLQSLPTAFVLLHCAGKTTARLGEFRLDSSGLQAARQSASSAGAPNAVSLRLSSSVLLEKKLSLPLAAERDVENVLTYSMDRETPFTADEVWWGFEPVHRDRTNGKLEVRLSLVPKSLIADLVEALDHGGLKPTGLDIPIGLQQSRQIALDEADHNTSPRFMRPLKQGLIACAALLAIAIIFPFVRQSVRLASVESQIASLRPAVTEAQELRQRLDGPGGADIVAAERAKLGNPMNALAAATTLLPDDTYLTDFTMQLRHTTLNGLSSNAAKLISTLAGSPSFKNPAFAAPVTRQDATSIEGFSITAEAVP